MQDLKEIRFVATNYFNLQGLRAVPLGLCLMWVCFWANGIQYPVKDFLLPVVGILGTLLLLFAIDRYYRHAFGRVQRTPQSRRFEWLVEAVAGILALGAFWLDTSFKMPLSLIGLVFAAGLLADYIRITWLVKGRFLYYYPLGAVLMAGVSVLPLLGIPNWWQALGLRTQLFGITTVIGVFSIAAGIWGHIFLVRTLSSRGKANAHTL